MNLRRLFQRKRQPAGTAHTEPAPELVVRLDPTSQYMMLIDNHFQAHEVERLAAQLREALARKTPIVVVAVPNVHSVRFVEIPRKRRSRAPKEQS